MVQRKNVIGAFWGLFRSGVCMCSPKRKKGYRRNGNENKRAFVGYEVKNFCHYSEMPNNPQTVTPAELSEFDKMRRATVARFTDEILKNDFGLNPRLAAFAREFAVSGKAENAARVVGYAPKTARKNAAKIARKTAPAVAVIRSELENNGAGFLSQLSGYVVRRLVDVAEMWREYPGAAVLALKALNEIYIGPVKNIMPAEETPPAPLDEIRRQAQELGIYE